MYDLIVIGDDLSSHVAAAYASQNGLSTLLVAESGLGGLHLIGDFVFHLDPTPMTGLGPDQIGRKILEEMGISLPAGEDGEINPAYQILLPNHRIDFFNTLDELLVELCREFPSLEADLRDFYESAFDATAVFENWFDAHPLLQPSGLKEFVSYLKIFPKIFRYKFLAVRFDKTLSAHPVVEKIWEAQQALCALNLHDLFSFSSAQLNCAPFRGVSFFSQGKQYLFNALIEKLETSNGLYLSHCRVASIGHGKPIEVELQTSDGKTTKTSAQALVVSSKADALSLICGPKNFSSVADRLRPAALASYPFSLFLGVKRSCLPEKLGRHVAIIPDEKKDLSDDNLLILHIPPPDSNHIFSEEKTALSVTVFLPDREELWHVEALKRRAEMMLNCLDSYFPFLRDNIELLSLDQSIDLSLAYRKTVSPKYFIRNAALTSFAAKTNKTRFENVFLTGASLLSDAGFAAEFVSGKNAAQRALNLRR